jgi:hypothetical protein
MGSTARVLQAAVVVEGMGMGMGLGMGRPQSSKLEAQAQAPDRLRATAATASSLTHTAGVKVKPQHQISAKWSSRASAIQSAGQKHDADVTLRVLQIAGAHMGTAVFRCSVRWVLGS